jgi:hypothetical protein
VRATGTPGALCIARVMFWDLASAHALQGQLRRARTTKTPGALCIAMKGCARPVPPMRSAWPGNAFGDPASATLLEGQLSFRGLRSLGRSRAPL